MSDGGTREPTSEQNQNQEQYEENLKFEKYVGHLELILRKYFEGKELWLGSIYVQYLEQGGLRITLEGKEPLSYLYGEETSPEEQSKLLAKMLEINELMKIRVQKEIDIATAQGLDTEMLKMLKNMLQKPGESMMFPRTPFKLKWGPDEASHAADLPQGEEVKGLTSTTGKAALEALRQGEK